MLLCVDCDVGCIELCMFERSKYVWSVHVKEYDYKNASLGNVSFNRCRC